MSIYLFCQIKICKTSSRNQTVTVPLAYAARYDPSYLELSPPYDFSTKFQLLNNMRTAIFKLSCLVFGLSIAQISAASMSVGFSVSK